MKGGNTMDKHESINAIKDFMNYCKVTDGI